MGQLAKHRVSRDLVFPKVDLFICANACVVEGDEVLTLRREECGAQELFVNAAQIPGGPLETAMGGRRLAICQDFYDHPSQNKHSYKK